MCAFEWDKTKADANHRKHGVSFSEAGSVFADGTGLLISDPDHSDTEARFILLGFSSRVRLLVVAHTYRESEDVIRIISAREADRYECDDYFRRLT